MIKIEVKSEAVEERRGHNGTTGKPWVSRKQRAYLHRPGEPYPDKFMVSLGDLVPYKVGWYELSPRAFSVGRYEDLEIDRFNVELVSVAK